MKTNLKITIMVNYKVMQAFGFRNSDGRLSHAMIVCNRGRYQLIKRGYDILFIKEEA